MKKVLSLVLVLVMVLAMATVAMAAPHHFYAAAYTDDALGNGDVLPADNRVDPGDKVYYQIVTDADGAVTDMEGWTVVIDFTKGRSQVSSYKLVQNDNDAYLYEIATKKNYGTTSEAVEANMVLYNAAGTRFAEKAVTLNVGWAETLVNGTGDSGNALVTNNAPVVVVDEDITKANITLANAYGDAEFEVRFLGVEEEKYNLYVDGAVDADIKIANKDVVDIEAINFLGNPSFDYTGELTVYTDLPYAYINNNGKLTAVDAKYYDADDDEWKIPASKLTSFIFAEDELVSVEADDTTTPDTNNPGTGSSDVVGVAVALAVVSLAAAGAVAFKKVK